MKQGYTKHNLVGKKFFRLTVKERIYDGKHNPRWKCICDCGKETIAISGNLLNNRHKSCGCYLKGPTARTANDKIKVNGYVFIKVIGHPRARKTHGWRVREHIVVMEKILGRYLLPGEEVHHLNGIRWDNRESNLELWTRSHAPGTRVKDKVKWVVRFLKKYAPEYLK